MAFPIENKLVIAVASSALFDLTESDAIFKSQGEDILVFPKEVTKNLLLLEK